MLTNICGVLVHAFPDRVDEVEAALAAMPGVEVHATTGDGRLVVCIDESPGVLAADTLARFHDVAGVIGASLVYHHCEDSDQLDRPEPQALEVSA